MAPLVKFLLEAILVSLSGVMAPGAVTAATIAQGTRSKYAGSIIALGHGAIEIPLIFLLMLGLGIMLKARLAQIIIGLAGGLYLAWMAMQMLSQIKKSDYDPKTTYTSHPFVTGVVLSATNPYFLVWWATVGLNLTIQAKQQGIVAILLFTTIHWLCDFVWLTILSWTTYKGTRLINPKSIRIILGLCGAALLFFGLKFIYDAAKQLF